MNAQPENISPPATPDGQSLVSSACSVPAVEITRMHGGGESWWYAMRVGKVLGASHEDNKAGMGSLRNIQAQNSQDDVR